MQWPWDTRGRWRTASWRHSAELLPFGVFGAAGETGSGKMPRATTPKPGKATSTRRSSGLAGRRASSIAFNVQIAVSRSRALAMSPCAVMPTGCTASTDPTAVGEARGMFRGRGGRNLPVGENEKRMPHGLECEERFLG